MLQALLLGIAYGFAAGISPGPTLGLIISETLRRGWRAGALVAVAPLFTDLPIILLAVFVLRLLPPTAPGLLALVGAAYVAYLGYETLRGVLTPTAANNTTAEGIAAPREELAAVLRRGIMTNALNPHPYIFWGTVGAPLLVNTLADTGVGAAGGFLLGFYALLVGLKLIIAALINSGRHLLDGRGYRVVIAASGVLLIGLALYLVFQGLTILFPALSGGG